MAKKVKAIATFIGTSDEVANHGGKIPTNLKDKEDKMSDAEKGSFSGKISFGTEFYVSDARANQLLGLGLVEILGDADGDDKKMEQALPSNSQKVGDINVKEKAPAPIQTKNDNAGPNPVKETPTKGTPE